MRPPPPPEKCGDVPAIVTCSNVSQETGKACTTSLHSNQNSLLQVGRLYRKTRCSAVQHTFGMLVNPRPAAPFSHTRPLEGKGVGTDSAPCLTSELLIVENGISGNLQLSTRSAFWAWNLCSGMSQDHIRRTETETERQTQVRWHKQRSDQGSRLQLLSLLARGTSWRVFNWRCSLRTHLQVSRTWCSAYMDIMQVHVQGQVRSPNTIITHVVWVILLIECNVDTCKATWVIIRSDLGKDQLKVRSSEVKCYSCCSRARSGI